TVAAEAGKPLLHLIGDERGRADEGKPAITADALRELAHGEFLARSEVDHPLTTALRRIGFGDRRQWAVGIEAGRIGSQYHGERGDGAVVMHHAVEQSAPFA